MLPKLFWNDLRNAKPLGDQQDLEGWLVSKQLELRDALEMGEIGIIKELTQLLAKRAVRLEGFFSMVSNMVGWNRFLRPTDFGADGAVSEWARFRTQDPCRLAVHAGWQRPFKIPATVFEGQLRSQKPPHSQTASAADWQFSLPVFEDRPKRLRTQTPDSGFQNDVDSTL